jgi:predicted lipoprotein with Yx(FWY)xxD motif
MLNRGKSGRTAGTARLRLKGLALGACALLTLPVALTVAQNRYLPIPPANSTELPPGISVKKTPIGDVYVDAKGRTLYGMDYRTLFLDTRNPATFCSGSCAETWEAVAAPPGTPPTPPPQIRGFGGGGQGQGQGQGQNQGQNQAAQAVLANQAQAAQVVLGFMGGTAPTGPDWTVTVGANGPQLMYKRTNLVFVRKGDAPGSTQWDGDDHQRWNALRYVPPVPKLVAPPNVAPLYVAGGYAFADTKAHVLYVLGPPKKCSAACEPPEPFRAGLISQGIGDWSVSRTGDLAQWLYRGKPVFVSEGAPKSADIPVGATILRP